MATNYTNKKVPWALRTFWSLNEEMHPEYKVTFVREIDASSMDVIRQRIYGSVKVKPSYTSLIIEAATKVLSEFPVANRAIIGPFFWKRLIQFKKIDITVAIEKDLPDAEAVVLAHTIRSCDHLTPTEITTDLQKALHTEMERWQLFTRILTYIPPFIAKWILRMPAYFPHMWEQHRGGACFINSPAKYGIDLLVADMLWPLTFSFGEVKERPIVINNKVVVRRTIPLTMIFDRRIMQGAIAARIFNRYCEILEGKTTLTTPIKTLGVQNVNN